MPETSAPQDLAELRAARRLRPVTEAEEGLSTAKLPNGVYGFAYAPQEAAIPLFGKKSWHSFEMHKLDDGSEHLAGFVTPEQAGWIRSGEHVEVTLFPDPWEDATEVVSVPMARVVPSKRGPSREGGNGLKLELL